MIIKHLQLNTSLLKDPKKIADFIKSNNIDIACLQEIVHPIGEECPLKNLVESNGYYYFEGINFEYLPNNQIVSEAIVSKYPIIDSYVTYYNGHNNEPKIINSDSILGELIDDNFKGNFPGSRGIKHTFKSRAILTATIDLQGKIFRIMTSHYSVSDLCTEAPQMYEISCQIASLVRHAKAIPTIFSGDLNIRAQSYSVNKLKEVLTCHTEDFNDTLSVNHPAKVKDFPEGLAIDHVFSANTSFKSIEKQEVDFSNHQAIVSEFEINL